MALMQKIKNTVLAGLGALALSTFGCNATSKTPEEMKVYTIARADAPLCLEHWMIWEQWKSQGKEIPAGTIMNNYISSPAREQGMEKGLLYCSYYVQLDAEQMRSCGFNPDSYVSSPDWHSNK